MRWLWLLLAACSLDHDLVPCGDLLCPVGSVCTPGGCATPEAADACAGLGDGDRCMTSTIPDGTCFGGSCRAVACGNAIIDHDEACDDGNQRFGDGCSADCRSNEVCGNQVADVVNGEECDRGVVGLAADGCSSTCTLELDLWRDASPIGITPRVAAMTYFARDNVALLFGGTVAVAETWQWDGTTWMRRDPATSPPPRDGHALVHDASHQRVLLFGGYRFPSVFNDTWEWDGVTWKQWTGAKSPPPRTSMASGFDPVRGRVVIFGGYGGSSVLGDTWEWDGTTWIERMPTTSPPPMSQGTMAYDPISRRLLLLRQGSGVETWAWDGTNWTLLGAAGLSPRVGSTMVTDTVANRLLLFGGELVPSFGRTNETYTWTGTAWALLTTSGTPPTARSYAPLAFDPLRNRVVLFGGSGPASPLGDTWELATAEWSQPPAPVSPLDRRMSVLAYDARRGRAVLLGGCGRSDWPWEWDGNNWQRKIAAAPVPTPRCDSAAAYDSRRGRTLMFGGFAGAGRTNELWSWDGTAWQLLATGPIPIRSQHAMAYDSARDRLVVFGGASTTFLGDTWEWDGATWSQVVASGPSARTSHVMTYDAARQRVVLFGGIDNSTTRPADTWEWDGATWIDRTPAVSPSARNEAGFAYDPLRRTAVLYGGLNANAQQLADTWEWDGTSWRELKPIAIPDARHGMAMTYDVIRHRVVLFGGVSATAILAKTWTHGFESAAAPPERCMLANEDSDLDGLAGCADPDCIGRCAPLCIPGLPCDPALPQCGDTICAPIEDYLICPTDCPGP